MGPHRDPHWKYKVLSKAANIRGWTNLAKDLTWVAGKKNPLQGRSIAAGASAAGMAAILGAQTKRISMPHKYKMPKRSRRKVVNRNGVKATKGRRRKVKRRKKSLSKRISSLEKNKAPQGVHTIKSSEAYTMETSAANTKIIYHMPGLTRTDNDVEVQTLPFLDNSATVGGKDFTANNSSVKILSEWISYEFKNQSTINITVSYAWYSCQDDSGNSPLNHYKEHLLDRGLSMGAVNARVESSATTSSTPQRIVLINNQLQYPIFGQMDDKWKRKGPKVITVCLAPGDSFSTSDKRGMMVYRPEIVDRTVADFYQRDSFLMLAVQGGLQHNLASNFRLVSFSGWNINAYKKRVVKYQGNSLEGAKTIVCTTVIDDTNVLADAVHADDKKSALETDNQT